MFKKCVLSTVSQDGEESTLITAMSETPASVIEALIAFFAVWSVLGLAGFHSYLAGTNQTTNEEVFLKSSRIYLFIRAHVMNYSTFIVSIPYAES